MGIAAYGIEADGIEADGIAAGGIEAENEAVNRATAMPVRTGTLAPDEPASGSAAARIRALVAASAVAAGQPAADALAAFDALTFAPAFSAPAFTAPTSANAAPADHAPLTRAEVAMALNVLLLADVLARVPAAARYVGEVVRQGTRITFDHGALRTMDDHTGALPPGAQAFARILVPLGYAEAGLYPLPRLHMTGHVFTHTEFPEDIPQFFVSALHVHELTAPVQAAAARVFGASVDPLGAAENALLAALAEAGECTHALAVAGLPGLARAFGRHHPEPSLDDYETLLAASEEAAWIATEGNAFNHATDRVADVEALAQRLKAEGYAIKASVECSRSGRVRQTALIAAKVTRGFIAADGTRVERDVPGSFHEFISRDPDPATGGLDLRFDAGNATGIFAVTNASLASATHAG